MSVHLAKGMRDILPAELRKRRFIIERIQRVFESFGFEPLQTPAVERIETLMGKYGDEGNKLIFRIWQEEKRVSRVKQTQHFGMTLQCL